MKTGPFHGRKPFFRISSTKTPIFMDKERYCKLLLSFKRFFAYAQDDNNVISIDSHIFISAERNRIADINPIDILINAISTKSSNCNLRAILSYMPALNIRVPICFLNI